MKKILFIISAFAFMQVSFGQKKVTSTVVSSSSSAGEGFRSSDWFISGAFGYSSEDKGGGTSTSEFALLPRVGYFLKDNLALVGTLGIINSSAGGGSSSNEFVIGADVRYYVTPTAKFSLFGQGGLQFRSGENTTKIIFGVKPGLNYFVAKNFSLEATFGDIGIVNTSPKVGDGTTDFQFGIDMTRIGLGLNYRF